MLSEGQHQRPPGWLVQVSFKVDLELLDTGHRLAAVGGADQLDTARLPIQFPGAGRGNGHQPDNTRQQDCRYGSCSSQGRSWHLASRAIRPCGQGVVTEVSVASSAPKAS